MTKQNRKKARGSRKKHVVFNWVCNYSKVRDPMLPNAHSVKELPALSSVFPTPVNANAIPNAYPNKDERQFQVLML